MQSRPAIRLCFLLAICINCFGQASRPFADATALQQEFRPLLPNNVTLVPHIAKFSRSKGVRETKPADSTSFAFGSTEDTSASCAHMIIIRPPKGLDPKMIVRVPAEIPDRIRSFKGLPVCAEDVR
jgi:hypothetical protein